MPPRQGQEPVLEIISSPPTDIEPLLGVVERLQIDLAAESPALLHQLRAGCAACSSKRACIRDLGREFDDAAWDCWYGYCVNAAALAAIGAAQNCARAVQYSPHPPRPEAAATYR